MFNRAVMFKTITKIGQLTEPDLRFRDYKRTLKKLA